jgi:hypothetical protein
MAALTNRQIRQFQQQQLQLQQQQLAQRQQQFEQQQEQQQKKDMFSRALSMMKIFGPGILEDPAVAEQIAGAELDPKSLLRRHKEDTKRAEEQLNQIVEQTTSIFTQPRVQKVWEPLIRATAQGVIDDSTARNMAETALAGLEQEDVMQMSAELKRIYPRLFRILPAEDAIKAAISIEGDRAAIRAGTKAPPQRRETPAEAAARQELRAGMLINLNPDDPERFITEFKPQNPKVQEFLAPYERTIGRQRLQTIYFEEFADLTQRLLFRSGDPLTAFLQMLMQAQPQEQQ